MWDDIFFLSFTIHSQLFSVFYDKRQTVYTTCIIGIKKHIASCLNNTGFKNTVGALAYTKPDELIYCCCSHRTQEVLSYCRKRLSFYKYFSSLLCSIGVAILLLMPKISVRWDLLAIMPHQTTFCLLMALNFHVQSTDRNCLCYCICCIVDMLSLLILLLIIIIKLLNTIFRLNIY